MSRRVIIIGAGPGGMATAMLLAKAGADVTVLEKQPRVGGRTSAIEGDATFNVSSTTSGGTMDMTNTLAFYSGAWTNPIAAYDAVKFRVVVPPEATRWKHFATHAGGFYLSLSQGSLPRPGVAHGTSTSYSDASLNQLLSLTAGWPWLPGYTYFLLITNTAATPHTY